MSSVLAICNAGGSAGCSRQKTALLRFSGRPVPTGTTLPSNLRWSTGLLVLRLAHACMQGCNLLFDLGHPCTCIKKYTVSAAILHHDHELCCRADLLARHGLFVASVAGTLVCISAADIQSWDESCLKEAKGLHLSVGAVLRSSGEQFSAREPAVWSWATGRRHLLVPRASQGTTRKKVTIAHV